MSLNSFENFLEERKIEKVASLIVEKEFPIDAFILWYEEAIIQNPEIPILENWTGAGIGATLGSLGGPGGALLGAGLGGLAPKAWDAYNKWASPENFYNKKIAQGKEEVKRNLLYLKKLTGEALQRGKKEGLSEMPHHEKFNGMLNDMIEILASGERKAPEPPRPKSSVDMVGQIQQWKRRQELEKKWKKEWERRQGNNPQPNSPEPLINRQNQQQQQEPAVNTLNPDTPASEITIEKIKADDDFIKFMSDLNVGAYDFEDDEIALTLLNTSQKFNYNWADTIKFIRRALTVDSELQATEEYQKYLEFGRNNNRNEEEMVALFNDYLIHRMSQGNFANKRKALRAFLSYLKSLPGF